MPPSFSNHFCSYTCTISSPHTSREDLLENSDEIMADSCLESLPFSLCAYHKSKHFSTLSLPFVVLPLPACQSYFMLLSWYLLGFIFTSFPSPWSVPVPSCCRFMCTALLMSEILCPQNCQTLPFSALRFHPFRAVLTIC